MTLCAIGAIVFAAACGSSPVRHRPMGKRELREHRPPSPAPRVTGVQPIAGGTGAAPVEGIKHRELYLDSIHGMPSPYVMDVRRWSEYFRDSLRSEFDRAGVSTATGPTVHVEVRSLVVDRPFVLGATTCLLKAEVIVRASGMARTHPVQAKGIAQKSHTCIGRAVAAAVRHIVAAPWLAEGEFARPAGPSYVHPPVEEAALLPDTLGRYGMQLVGHFGVGGLRLQTSAGDSSHLGWSWALGLDVEVQKNFFFSGSVHVDAGTLAAAGAGFSGYVGGSLLLSASFIVGGAGSDEDEVSLPALGGQLLFGKQFQVSPSLWLGVATRPVAMWSLDGGHAFGMSLLSTVVWN